MNVLEQNNGFRLSGRTTWQKEGLFLGYSASFIEFKFYGRMAEAEFITARLDAEVSLVKQAVEQVKALGDDKVFFIEAFAQKEEDGIGADYHPSEITQKKFAAFLAEYIKKTGLLLSPVFYMLLCNYSYSSFFANFALIFCVKVNFSGLESSPPRRPFTSIM